MFLGDYIVIEHQIRPFEFACCSVSTGTPFIGRVDADKRDLFTDPVWKDRHPSACPFLRPSGDRIVCTIHETRPVQCREYRCVILRIYSRDEQEVGRVSGTYGLMTDDLVLRSVWEEGERVIDWWADDVEQHINRLLVQKGYILR